jgi:hypothetical protein
MRTKI